MSFVYAIQISVDFGAVVPEIDALMNQLNSGIANAGWDEKLMLRSKLMRCIITSDHELTEDQKTTVKKAIIETIAEQQPAWRARIESFRRKSGNVQQQVA